MNNIIPSTAEVRTVDFRAEQRKVIFAGWFAQVAAARLRGRTAKLHEAMMLHNLHTCEAWKDYGCKSWKELMAKFKFPKRSSYIAINIGTALLALCPEAVYEQDDMKLFDDKKAWKSAQKFYEDHPKITLEDLAAINNSENTLDAVLYGERDLGMSTDEILDVMLDAGKLTNKKATDPLAPKLEGQLKLGESLTASLEARLREAGYTYDAEAMQWRNPDGTPMTYEQLGEFIDDETGFLIFREVERAIKPAREAIRTRIEQLKRYTIAYALRHTSPAHERALNEEAQRIQKELAELMHEVSTILKRDDED